tara:strand:+ start:2003 stop:2917 length:915 start_codon:yes stop_codon:yes gene_type:complete
MTEKIFLKEIVVGPMVYKKYMKYKLKEFKNIKEGYFFFDRLNDLTSNIYQLTENIKYYWHNGKVSIETKITFNNRVNKCAANRKISINKIDKSDKSSIKSAMYYFITPPDKEIDEYRKIQLKKYADYEENFQYKIYSNNVEIDFDGNKVIHKKITGFNEELSDITTKIDKNNKNNKFKLFKPKASIIKYLNKKQGDTAPGKNTKYTPPGLRKNNGESVNTSLVIKNIPTNYNYDTIYNELKVMFNKYGIINKIKLLKNKDTEQLTGIGFIDCIDIKTTDKILNCNQRFCINHSVLSIERSKRKK